LICDAARAAGSIRSIFYALPAFENTNALARNSPNFLDDTYVIDPLEIGYINDNRPHEFVINTAHGTYQVHSKKILKSGKILKIKSVFDKFQENHFGTTVEKFTKNLQTLSDEKETKQRFRKSARISPKAIIT